MYPEEQGILAQPKKLGPLTAVAMGITGIAGHSGSTEQQPKPAALDPFAYRGGYPASAPRGPSNGPDSTALTPIAQGIAAPMQNNPSPAVQQIAQNITAEPGIRNVATPEVRQVSGEQAPSSNVAQVGIAAPMNIGSMTNEQRMGAANAFGDGVDKATGVSSSGAAGIGGLTKRFDAYAKNDGILAMRNAREDLLGSGIRLERDGNGGMTITNNGNADNPLLAAGGSIINMAEGNAVMARANKVRGEMIDGMITANGGNGIGILGEMPTAVAPMRGQEQGAGIANRPRMANPLADELTKERIQGAQLHNDQTQRLNDLQQQLVGEADPGKRNEIADQIKALSGRTERPSQGERLTLPQRRSNFEIEAARKAVAGLTPDEIKRKTANFTATGRENPDYDPTLAKAITQANHRKYGEADDWFDQRQQAQQPAGTDGDQATRFRADKAMSGHSLGKQTDQGYEVHDASGRLVGHYR